MAERLKTLFRNVQTWLEKNSGILFAVIFFLTICGAIYFWVWDLVKEERSKFPIEVALNEENAEYGQICLYVDEFNLGNKTVHSHIYFDAGPKLQQFPNEALDALDTLGNITIITIRPTPTFLRIPRTTDVHDPIVQNAQRWSLNPSSPFNLIEVEARLAGSESAFPFDSYAQTFWFPVAVPEGVEVSNTTFPILVDNQVPLQFRVNNNISGYRVMGEAEQNNILTLRIERPWQTTALVMLVWCVLTLLSMLVFLFTVRKVNVGETLPFIIGIAAVVIAVPTARIALVPSEIPSWTVLDMILLVPLGLSFIALAYATYQTFYWRFSSSN